MAENCWVLTHSNGDDVDTGDCIPHFPTEALATERAGHYSVSGDMPKPRHLDQPCTTITCDCCEYVFDEDDDIVHFEDMAEAEKVLPDHGWTQTGGVWRCETCTKGPCDLEADTHG